MSENVRAEEAPEQQRQANEAIELKLLKETIDDN